jgi:eukaryotic-like serine/threonine-protein kinase
MTPVAENTVVDGRYRVLYRIGSGGMAEVWCAEDSLLGRKVALKILHARFAQDREFVERFRREASAAAGLQHPNVVNVFDRGEFDGTYYIAMEYLEGASLKDLITRGLPIGEAIAIVRQILTAARFAHQRGIIHRDLKPHNVLVDREGRATVTDFGIVAHAGSSEITQTGSIMGTAQYLSPEQAQGLEVTPASDLYSIGVILYESLTGRVPFEADSAVAVALKQVSETPRPPSSLNSTVPPALDAVVMRALAKDPAHRFANSDEFMAALDAAAMAPGSAPDQPPPPGPPPGERTEVRAPATPAPYPAAAQPGWPPATPRRRPGPRTLRWALVAASVAVVAGFAAFAFTRPGRTEVPDVIGNPVAAATQVLETRGFDVDIQTRVNNALADTVLEQDPPAGNEAEKGSTVVLTVSSGPGTIDVPPVADLEERVAVEKLESSGFEVEVSNRFDEQVEAGAAIGTEPGAGVEVKRGLTVTLLISKGPERVEVPDLVGATVEVAQAELRAADLVPDIEQRDDDAPEGQVVAQAPAGGRMVKPSSSVTIFVSSGEGSIEVRDVVGRNVGSAANILRGQGLGVSRRSQDVSSQSQDGKVISQSPPGGSQARQGDTVTLTVGRLTPLTEG